MNRIHPQCDAKTCPLIGVPQASSVRACLGPSLAKVFFQYAHNDTTSLLNVLTPPKTSKACFSVSSEEDTRPAAPAPPSNNQIIKALVHQNILEIGGDILKRVEKEIERKQREIIEKQSHQKFYMYQAKKRRDAEKNVQRLHAKYQNYLNIVQEEIQEQIDIEWAKITVQHRKDLQKAMVQERINVVHEMMQKMRIEISHIVQVLYKDFEDSFRAQREIIIADFNQIMREKHVQLKKEMFEFETKMNKQLYIQKHELEMQNATDLLYTLCLERFRCDKEKHTIHTHFEEQLEEIHEMIVRLKEIITLMRNEIINCHMEKKSLEKQLCEITTHFQKFIDFVLQAVPRQAEYLLPLEIQRLITLDKNEEKKI